VTKTSGPENSGNTPLKPKTAHYVSQNSANSRLSELTPVRQVIGFSMGLAAYCLGTPRRNDTIEGRSLRRVKRDEIAAGCGFIGVRVNQAFDYLGMQKIIAGPAPRAPRLSKSTVCSLVCIGALERPTT
jgi:hypothetical protein